MAEGGYLGTSPDRASDASFDFSCFICEEKDRNTGALVYCKQCDKPMCKTCNELHSQLFSKHLILDKDNSDRWGGTRRDFAMDMCEAHSDKEADMFCSDHDAVCCHMCASTKHRTCKMVHSIQDAAKGNHQKPEFQKMLKSVSMLQDRLNEMRKRKHSNKKQLQNESVKILSAIKALRQKINETLNAMELNAKQQLDLLLTDSETALKSDIDACQFVHDELKKIHGDIQTKRINDESSAFRAYKTCEKKYKESKEFLISLQAAEDITLFFTPNPEVERILSSLDTFGLISSNTTSAASSTTSMTTSSAAVESLYQKTHVYSIDNIKEYDVRIGSDTETCRITGVCVLPDGKYAITDQTNETVKLLNDKYAVIDECEFIGRPDSLCHITDGVVAVTTNVHSSPKILFFETKQGKLTRTRSVNVNYCCNGITYHNEHMYIGSGDGLFMYNVLCTKMEQILFPKPTNCVAVGDNGKRIYAIHGGCLSTLDQIGNQLFQLNDRNISGISGIAVAGHGNVFVCCKYPPTIFQIEKKGRKTLSTLATKEDGLVRPSALCFNWNTSELIVGQGSDKILVIKLK